MITKIIYVHGLRHHMSLTHANACAIMVHGKCTRVYQSVYIVLVKKQSKVDR
jgi:hypothetical protein